MHDEDTGEDVECPFCGSGEDCEHLLAVLDMTFHECRGGSVMTHLDTLRNQIQSAFAERLRTQAAPVESWKWDHLGELWDYSEDAYQSSGEVEIEEAAFLGLVVELLEQSGGEEYPGSVIDEGGPGFTSSMIVMYAADPAAVVGKASGVLRSRLMV
ncbi:MAG: hypothetical protein M3P51_03325 [Chloroflexota bacterium]|nr:hypothetical protein [Chloroflexota bacterium]